MIKVTVALIAYNHEKYIKDALDSIVNQSYKNIQFIVINDYSTDNTNEIILEYQKKYQFDYINNEENKGLCYNLNKAIDLAAGKYIALCASDDYWAEDKIEKQVSFYEKNPDLGFIYGRYHLVDNNNNITGTDNTKPLSGNIFDSLLIENTIGAVTVMVKKDVYEKVGKYNPELQIEDYYMWLKITNKFQVAYMNEFLAYYRQHENNFSKKTVTMIRNEEKIIYQWKSYKSFRKVEKKWLIRWTQSLMKHSYRKEAKPYLLRLVRKGHFLDKKVISCIIKYFFH